MALLLVWLAAAQAAAQTPPQDDSQRAPETAGPTTAPSTGPGPAVPLVNTGAAPEGTPAQPTAPTPGLGVSIGPLDFAMHGYFRAPLRMGWRSRCGGTGPCDQPASIHSPWLVDDDYFLSGFLYTRIQESDWAELYMTVGNKYLTGQVALMGSLFSDWAQPFLNNQLGIAQAFLSLHWQTEGPRLRFRFELKAGSFWDRFGWLEHYDTYVFGRTHQMGGQSRLDFGWKDWTFSLLQGVGVHQEAIDANEGLTILNYLHAGVRWRQVVEAGFYFLDSFTRDQRQLVDLKDGDMRIYGMDLRLDTARTGRLYVAASTIGADQATFLSPAIEVMHAYGGRGLTENYLGSVKSNNGTGSLWNLALEHHYSFHRLLQALHKDRVLRGRDVWLDWFGMMVYTLSKQADPNPAINRDAVLGFKWGAEAGAQVFSWLMFSLRYDRVIPNVQDDAGSFRILTPRLTFITHYLLGAQLYLQYSRYYYGDRVALRPGQVLMETAPDNDVFKIQAQLVF